MCLWQQFTAARVVFVLFSVHVKELSVRNMTISLYFPSYISCLISGTFRQ